MIDCLIELVNEGIFEFCVWFGCDEDKYGCKFCVFICDGRSFGDIFVLEGLVRIWMGCR